MENKPKYLGSVRFFKHIILVLLALLILIPTTLSIIFGIQNINYRTRLQQREQELEQQRQARRLDFGSDVPAEPAPELTPAPLPVEHPSYQFLYPEMYAPETDRSSVDQEKTVYLTFDDGPSNRTPEVLEILEEYGVKATFFLVGKPDETSRERIREIAAAGHTIGLHSYTHEYKDIYQSVESFLADFKQEYDLIHEITGEYPTIFRFPGGSINTYNMTNYRQLVSEMVRRGFVFFDWNVSGGDASSQVNSRAVYAGATANLERLRRAVVLLHDGEQDRATVEALPDIIEAYQDAGFTFERLTAEVVPVVFTDLE